jgi:hypothetical protein
MLSRAAVAACAALLATPAPAQQTGELWEMTSQMSMQGMPAGMIPAQTQQVCQGQNFDRTPGEEDRSKCTISNMRQSPTRIQYDVRCEGNPPVTGSADYQFEANRTRMKGTMRMVTRDGEMVMQMTGRKVGACNPQEAQRAQQKQVDDFKKQAADMQKQGDDEQIRACRQDLDKMQPGFGLVGLCAAGEQAYCSAASSVSSAVRTACTADMKTFCSRYQTRDGLLKIGTRKDTLDQVGKMCKQPVASVRARLCPAAVKEDALRFVAQHCPAEARVIAQRECGGRAFSVAEGSKYFEFCGSYRGAVADAGDDDSRSSGTLSKPAAARPAAQSQPSQASQPAQPAAPADAASQAIQEGLGKLKGLFGR